MLRSSRRASHLGRYAAVVALLGIACGDSAAIPDTSFDVGAAAFDASVPDAPDMPLPDAGFDAGRDSGPDVGTSDSGFEAGADATFDAGPICDCPASTLCLAQVCIDGACIATPEPPGTACGEMPLGVPEGVCLEGACVMRGCGDGYREPGPVTDEPAPAREGCDDGNVLDGDACSASCEPAFFEVVPGALSGGGPVIRPQLRGQRPALAVDDSGRVLVTWLETQSSESVVFARRFTPEGVAVGDIVEVVRGSGAGLPVPVGLAEGWALLHSSRSLPLEGFVFRRVSVDGTLGAPRVVPGTERSSSPFATRHGEGVLAVWTRSVSSQNRVYARRLDASGVALDAADIEVTPHDVMRQADNPRVASIRAEGETTATAAIAWRDGGGDYPTIYVRRLRDTAAGVAFIDAAPFELPTDPIPFAGGCYVAALSGGTSAGATPSEARFVVAWSGGEVMRSDTSTTISFGRVMVREVTGASGSLPPQQVLAVGQGGDNFPVVVPEPGLGPSGETTFVAAWHASTGGVILGDRLPPEVGALRASWSDDETTFGLVATPHAGYGPGIWVTSEIARLSSSGLSAFLLPYPSASRSL